MKSNIDDVIRFIDEYDDAIVKGVAKSIEEITKLALETVKQYCEDVNLSTHLSNIHSEYDPITNVGTIWTDDEVIVFKEMGTGIVGSNNPHPSPSEEFATWTYDVNKHGEEGWKYPKGDGTFGWTKGLPAGSMFYKTFIDIKDNLDPTIQVEIHKSTQNLY